MNNKAEYVVQIPNGRSIRFYGEEIAHVSSETSETKRWLELALYRTAGGKYVCERISCNIEGNDHYSGRAVDTIEEVLQFFGFGWISKRLYDAANIDYSERID